MSGLREQQRQYSHELIVRAAAQVIVEHGLDAFSFQAVADQAGVSKRTVYNYFDSREALIAGVEAFSRDEVIRAGGFLHLPEIGQFSHAVARNYRAWAALEALFEATLVVESGNPQVVSTDRRDRRRQIEDRARDAFPDLNASDRADVARLFSALGSSSLYRRLVIDDELDAGRAADIVAWVIDRVIDGIETGEFPISTEPISTEPISIKEDIDDR